MLVSSVVCVVVCWVTVDETVEEDCVERESPIGWRFSINVVITPFSIVVEW